VLYSHTSELAIRAARYLASQPPGKLTPVHEVAAATGMSKAYLSKILRQLIRARVVRGIRGPGGGVELGRAPADITLWLVRESVEGPLGQHRCVLEPRTCSADSPCALHTRWSPLRTEVQRLLEETTLADLVRQVEGKEVHVVED
jgi:Rrf2 family protein